MSPTEEDLTHVRDVLTRYVKVRVHDVHAAEDLVQDIVLAAAQTHARRGDLLPYLLGIARHKCSDWQREVARSPAVLVADPPDGCCDADGPEENALRNEQVRLARALLANVSERDAELLLMRMSGCTASETAEALGMSPGAVRVAQHRALNALRRLTGVDP